VKHAGAKKAHTSQGRGALPRGSHGDSSAQTRCGRVLAGLRTGEPGGRWPDSYCPPLPGPSGPVHSGGGRFRLPLRGSPGIPPGSLLAVRPQGRTDTNTCLRIETGRTLVNRVRKEADGVSLAFLGPCTIGLERMPPAAKGRSPLESHQDMSPLQGIEHWPAVRGLCSSLRIAAQGDCCTIPWRHDAPILELQLPKSYWVSKGLRRHIPSRSPGRGNPPEHRPV